MNLGDKHKYICRILWQDGKKVQVGNRTYFSSRRYKTDSYFSKYINYYVIEPIRNISFSHRKIGPASITEGYLQWSFYGNEFRKDGSSYIVINEEKQKECYYNINYTHDCTEERYWNH